MLSGSVKRLRKILPRNQAREHEKLVVAHFMVGNTAPYVFEDWLEDIQLASLAGIDGFALNIGNDDWQSSQIKACFDAAEAHAPDFKLFLSYDMSSFPASSVSDVHSLVETFRSVALRESYMRYSGKALVSTFSGENSFFGQETLEGAWTFVKAELEKICPVKWFLVSCFTKLLKSLQPTEKIFFVPSFFIEPRRVFDMYCVDGAFNWNGGWPIHLTPDSPPEEIKNPSFLTDKEYTRWLSPHGSGRKCYMASISPWFFTHYGKDSWNKNWIYRGDDWLLVRRWQHLISMRNEVDIVQIISWNDYGESHYIGPIKGAQPNSQAWVDGFDHTPWLHLSRHFIRSFMRDTTSFPRGPGGTFIYVWARPHPRESKAVSDVVGKPANWKLTEDIAWIVILTDKEGNSEVKHLSGCDTPVVRQSIKSGVNLLLYPLVKEGHICIRFTEKGSATHSMDFVPTFEFSLLPETYNFNAFVEMYPRAEWT